MRLSPVVKSGKIEDATKKEKKKRDEQNISMSAELQIPQQIYQNRTIAQLAKLGGADALSACKTEGICKLVCQSVCLSVRMVYIFEQLPMGAIYGRYR